MKKIFISPIHRIIIYFILVSAFLCMIYYIAVTEYSHAESNPKLKQYFFKDPPVFFVETSGSGTLNARQGCAAESAALHNPSMHIYVLMTSADGIDYGNELMKKLTSIPNVHVLHIRIEDLAYDTPMLEWYKEGKWKESQWMASHLSDGLRFLLLWKYGGIYLDMDVVTIRTLKHLKNCAVSENENYIGSAILIFDRHHEMMKRTMFDFAKHYDPYQFAANGPHMVTNNFKSFCNTSNLKEISEANCDTDVLKPDAAFPIPYYNWKQYFEPTSVKNVTDVFPTSYVIHVWNKLSSKQNLKLGTDTLYELAFKQHCPSMYTHAMKIGIL